MKIEIACPKCKWKDDGGSHWICSCGQIWNTFSTGGNCPRCSKNWADTQCPTDPGGCGRWSKHIDWYKNLDDILKEQLNEIEEIV